MFNSGYRGRRAPDNAGAINPQIKYTQVVYPVPTITGWSISGSDDTALNPAGGQTVLVNGTGFAAGCAATLNGSTISPVTLVSPTQISFTSPALAGGSYTLIVYNSSGGAAILVPGLTYSAVPTWTTAAGSIGSYYETTAISTAVVATSDSAMTYTLASGSLPAGATLYANGVITGTAPVDSSSTTYTFGITATDAELQDTTRTFTLTINVDVVTWVTPSSGATITLDGSAYSQALSATDAAGYAVSYTANTLPTGLTLSAGTISGTPTVEGNTSSLLTATAATTGRSATNTVTWVVSLTDTYFKYVTTLLSANASVTTSSFVNDNSLNNAVITVAGDTRAQNSNPYQPGYYSTYFNGGTFYNLSNQLALGSGDFTIEFWFYALDLTNRNIYEGRPAATNGAYPTIYITSSAIRYFVSSADRIVSSTISANTWYHLAVVRSAGITKMYLNGTQTGSSYTDSTTYLSGASRPVIGTYDGSAGFYYGYLSNLRVANIAFYTNTFTPSTTPLLPVAGTLFLSSQSNRIIDTSPSNFPITLSATAPTTSTATPFTTVLQAGTQYYGASFDGSGDYLTLPSNQAAFTMGTGDFTVEMWVYIASLSTQRTLYDTMNQSDLTGTGRFGLQVTTGGVVQVYTLAGTILTSGGTLVANTWYHIAYSRNYGDGRLYVNGVKVNSSYSDKNNYVVGTTLRPIIGINAYDNSSSPMLGVISNLRVTKGVAVYTANFVPSTTALTATTTVTAAQSWSTAFDGTGDYLTVPAGAAFNLTTVDFSIEFWVYPISQSLYGALFSLDAGDYPLMFQWASAGSANIRFYAGSASTWITGMPLTFGTTALNSWQHLCVTRTSGVFRVFMNGVLGATLSDATAIGDSSGNIYIGSNGTTGYASQAYISNLRFIKGSVPTGYQTSSTTVGATIFTPSTSPLTTTSQGATAANVSLLTCQNNLLQDNSTNYFAVTSAGDARPASANPFVSTNGIGGTSYSGYFDGSGDYLDCGSNAAVTSFSGTDFTWEAWVYPTGWPQNFGGFYNATIMGTMPNSGTSGFELTLSGTASSITSVYVAFKSVSGFSSSYNMYLNTWYHVAVTKSSSTVRVFVNGVQIGSGTYTTWTDATPLTIGSLPASSYRNYFTGYISNLRIVKGTALYTASFTPSTTPLTAVANTQLLTCQSTTFIDNSSNALTITAAGNAATQTFNPFSGATSLLTCQSATLTDNSAIASTITAVGNAQPVAQSPFTSVYYSNWFNGSTDYLLTATNSAFNLSSTVSWTLEYWVYLTTLATYQQIAFFSAGSSNSWTAAHNIDFGVNTSGNMYIEYATGSSPSIISGATVLSTNTWYHLAYVYNGSAKTITTYVNGARDLNASSMSTYAPSTATPRVTIGRIDPVVSTPTYFVSGYISNFRITNGQTLYTTTFTPSTAPLTTTSQGATASNVALLTCQSLYFVDNSTNVFAITQNGSPKIAGTAPFTQPTGYSASAVTTYGSGYFDGTGDYVNIPDIGTSLDVQASDFTIECWCYPTVTPSSTSTIISKRANINTYGGIVVSNASLTPSLLVTVDGSSWGINTNSSISFVLNAWNHMAVVRSGTNWKMFINGAQGISATLAGTVPDNTAAFTIGAAAADGTYPVSSSYISDFRVVKGTALYTSAFVPQFTAPLTAVTNTQLLTLQTRGAHNNSDFVDQSGFNNVVTRNGNATNGTFDPYGNNWSVALTSGADLGLYLGAQTAFSFGTGDFNIELWVMLASTGANQVILDFRPVAGNGAYPCVYFNSSNNKITYYVNSADTIVANSAITYNTWNHVAISRSSSVTRMFINGVVQTSTYSDTTNYTVGANRPYTGNGYGSSNQMTGGYISNLRIVKGQALYTTTFTPSTAPLTVTSQGATAGNVSLLTAQSNRYIDNSPNNFTVNTTGTLSVQKFSPFSTVTLPTYYSTYFGTRTDYISTPAVANLTTFTGDFTFEAWVYPSDTSVTYWGIWDARQTGGTANAMIFALDPLASPVTGQGRLMYYNGSYNRGTGTVYYNQWSHIAFVRAGSTMTFYINGTAGGTATVSGTQTASATSNPIYIGSKDTGVSGAYGTVGYISNFRIVNGVAVYTGNFTPPTAPLSTTQSTGTNIAAITGTQTVFLACQSNTMVDNSSNYYVLTSGSTTVKPLAVNPFTPTASSPVSYTPTTFGGSMYFDGSSDYLTVTNSIFTTTGDFTVECWAYVLSAQSGNYGGLFSTRDSSNSAGISINLLNTGYLDFGAYPGGGYTSTLTPLNQWFHVAMTRSGSGSNNVKCFLNGVQVGTISGTATTSTNSGLAIIGRYYVNGINQYFLSGYISDLRYTVGTALYTANFYPGATPATPTYTIGTATYSSVLLLNGASGGVIDFSRTVDLETVADAKAVQNSPYSGTYYSNLFDGGTSYFTATTAVALPIGTETFTVEMWLNKSNAWNTANQVLLISSTASSFQLWVDSATSLIKVSYNGGTTPVSYSTSSLSIGVWYHLAVVRSGSSFTMYVNGTSVATGTDSGSFATPSSIIIANYTSGTTNGWNGYISNLRIVRGTAVYTGNFTPSTTPLTAVSGTSLLTCQSNKFVDNSSNAVTLTVNGTPKVQTQNPFAVNTGTAYYFDGTGDYLSMSTSVTNNLSTGNFTIEFWVNPTTWYGSVYEIGGASQYLVIYRNNSSSTTKMGVRFNNNASSDIFSTADVPVGQWSYWALVRNNGTVTWYCNGVAGGSASYATAIPGGTATLGYSLSFSIAYTGYIADFRLTNGVARYTATFTPPTAPVKTY